MINLKTLIDTDVDNFSIGKFFDFAGGQPIIEETVQDWIKECLAKAIVDKKSSLHCKRRYSC